MACPAASSAAVGSSSSQIGRRHGDQPRERQPAALAGGQVGGRQVRQAARAEPRQAPTSGSGSAAEEVAQKCEVFADRQRRLERILVAEIVRLLRQASPPGPPRSSAGCPSVGRISPAISRSNVVLPAPLGPVTTSASPAPTAKLSSRKIGSGRPARRQGRSPTAASRPLSRNRSGRNRANPGSEPAIETCVNMKTTHRACGRARKSSYKPILNGNRGRARFVRREGIPALSGNTYRRTGALRRPDQDQSS